MSAFLEDDRVIILSEDGFDGEEGVITKVDQPDPGDYTYEVDEATIDADTTYYVVLEDGRAAWFEESELEHV
jgi:hypothetical protein